MSLDDNTVWKWAHETGAVRAVAFDFADFVSRVLEDWEHVLAGDGSWDYLSG